MSGFRDELGSVSLSELIVEFERTCERMERSMDYWEHANLIYWVQSIRDELKRRGFDDLSRRDVRRKRVPDDPV